MYGTFMFAQTTLQPIDGHGGAMRIVLWRTRRILVARRTQSVIATGHELSVEVSSGPE